MQHQPNEFYDLIIADPPYNECVDTEWDQQWQNDTEYLRWLEMRIAEFHRLLKSHGNLLLYCKRQLLPHIHLLCDKYLIEQRIIIWVRRRNVDTTRGKSIASGYEPILWYSKTDDFVFNADLAKTRPSSHLRHRKEYRQGGALEKGVSLTDAWTDINALPHNSKEKTDHPTQKPLQLSLRLVNLFSLPTSRVYIPFAGSGSEIEACIQLHHAWDATEINATYCANILKRLGKISVSLDQFSLKN